MSQRDRFAQQLRNLEQRGFDHDMNADDLVAMLTAQKARCARTGISFEFVEGSVYQPKGPMMSRKDASEAWSLANTHLVLRAVGRMSGITDRPTLLRALELKFAAAKNVATQNALIRAYGKAPCTLAAQ